MRDWLGKNADRITHFRPRRIGGTWWLLAYDRREAIPFIDGQPQIEDTPENVAIIRRVFCGRSVIEDPLTR